MFRKVIVVGKAGASGDMIANHSVASCEKLTAFVHGYLQSTLLAIPPREV